jgi:hypothetical protein
MNTTRRKVLWPGVAVTAAALLAGACSGSSGAENTGGGNGDCVRVFDEETGRTGSECLPTAPEKDRVDLAKPDFTHPTEITNPLHPTGKVAQTVYGGQVDDKPFRTEVSRLPDTKKITWDGRTIPAVVVQYVAFSDGRIQEVALDWYAQADDGSVWYLGEDVFNYEDGVVADTEGTWQAGEGKAPAGMIMPARPEKGDVYRPENLPGVVFEEVEVKAVDQTVPGPYGPVEGAITVRELHMDGTYEDKVFAPGYGEFSTGTKSGELEAASLAVPTDAVRAPVPERLTALDRAARAAVDGGESDTSAVRELRGAWDAYRASDRVPDLLRRQMTRDLDTLAKAVAAKDAEGARGAALRCAQNTSDLRLRYEPLRTVDLDRLELWARQLRIDATARDDGAVAGDVTSLELVWERLRDDAPKEAAAGFGTDLKAARAAADRGDTAEVERLAPQLVLDIGQLR